MRKSLALLLALCVLAPAACAGTSDVALARADVPRAAAAPGDAKLAAGAINAFGLDLYRQLASSGGDVVVSPASIALALGMARAGAKGETAAEMDRVLHELGADRNASWLNALDAALATRTGTFKDVTGKDQPVTLRIANTTFAQKDYAWIPAYLEALAARFGAGVRLVDFAADTEAARKAINAWVADQTDKRIPELIEQGVLDSATRMALVNAVYLKAAWLTPFPESDTKDAPFTKLDGSTVTVPFMHAFPDVVRYAKGDGWQAVDLPYVGEKLALTLILPSDLRAFEKALDAGLLGSIVGGLEAGRVDLRLPKFGIETKVDLATTLAAMGMPTAFDADTADFSGMTSQERLYISAVIHQANIDVDEKGTTAAAATAVVMRASGAPAEPVVLTFDHPFLFALRDVDTGAVLFLGRVMEPHVRS